MAEIELSKVPLKKKPCRKVQLEAKRIERQLTDNYYKQKLSEEAHDKHHYRASPSLEQTKHDIILSLDEPERKKAQRSRLARQANKEIAAGFQRTLEGDAHD